MCTMFFYILICSFYISSFSKEGASQKATLFLDFVRSFVSIVFGKQ